MPHSARQDTAGTLRVARRLYRASLIFLVLLFPVVLFSDRLAAFTLGESFAAAGSALAWSVLSLPALALAPPLGSVLQSRGLERLVAINGMFFAVLTLCAVAIGTVTFGAAGAAAAVTISYSCKSASLIVMIEARLRAGTNEASPSAALSGKAIES
jgi:O-antigen/teichoic acid export membrane protein